MIWFGPKLIGKKQRCVYSVYILSWPSPSPPLLFGHVYFLAYGPVVIAASLLQAIPSLGHLCCSFPAQPISSFYSPGTPLPPPATPLAVALSSSGAHNTLWPVLSFHCGLSKTQIEFLHCRIRKLLDSSDRSQYSFSISPVGSRKNSLLLFW